MHDMLSCRNATRTRNERQTAPATTSRQMQHMSDLEHVRERPACTSATRDVRGLHHLVYEVVDNSIDEAMAGFATEISR